MATNRMTGEDFDRTLAQVKAHWGLHWRCPKCGLNHIAAKSATHEAVCRDCNTRYLVNVLANRDMESRGL